MRFNVGSKIFSAFGLLFGVFLLFGVLMYSKANTAMKESDHLIRIKVFKSELSNMRLLHQQKLRALGLAIHKKEMYPFSTIYEDCEFTKWRSSYKLEDLIFKDDFEKLDEPHKHLHEHITEIVSYIKVGDYDKARALYIKTSDEYQELQDGYAPLFEKIDAKSKELTQQEIQSIEDIRAILFIALIIIIVLIVVFYLWLKRSIITPSSQMTKLAKKISQGDVQQTIAFTSKDEIGDLADAFREMINYMQELSDVAHKIGEGNLNVTIVKRSENDMLSRALENMVINLNTIMFELKHGVLSLNSASAEILATTTQVVSSATQTSSAVAQTSASIEEIKQTAKASSAKATQTTESTNKAMDIAKNGTDKLIENMQGLAQIKEKMDLIASNIILLSQQSQQIGEITSTVEDIANQSNMLAVNASIEAVKAGEQGKGFSVVALELKNLSEQSKQGVKQVQKILTDIQKVTGTLVMVAEQGAKVVEGGVKQALSAKTSMDKLNETVMNAANAGKQISASYEQELAGMKQISEAMSSVKEATMQNLSSIKQVEASAHDLNGLSQKIREVMEHYIIADTK